MKYGKFKWQIETIISICMVVFYVYFVHMFAIRLIHDKRMNEHSINKMSRYTGNLCKVESLFMVFRKL